MKASDIRTAMAARWAAPQYAIMWEVGEGTGTRTGRWADAVIMGLWPSRGLLLEGVEIKTSRADWRREAKDPKKAEAIAKYCDLWWVHTTPGVVDDVSEVPPNWGLREFDGTKWRTIREAARNTSPSTIDRVFLAALLRRGDESMRVMLTDAVAKAREAELAESSRRRADFAGEVQRGVDRRTEELAHLTEWKTAFEAIFGEGLVERWGGADAQELARLCREVEKSDVLNSWNGVFKLAEQLREMAGKLDNAFASLRKDEKQ